MLGSKFLTFLVYLAKESALKSLGVVLLIGRLAVSVGLLLQANRNKSRGVSSIVFIQ